MSDYLTEEINSISAFAEAIRTATLLRKSLIKHLVDVRQRLSDVLEARVVGLAVEPLMSTGSSLDVADPADQVIWSREL
jgi:cysteine sulfinate desulfinase/cysteine desulfurase-like protein